MKRTHRWGEGSIVLGIIAFSVYLILGVCSLPSVASKLSWREWNFIQSVIGYLGLATGGIHAFLLLVTSLCNDRKLACQEFFPLNPAVALAAWPGRVPTRTYFHCFSFIPQSSSLSSVISYFYRLFDINSVQ